MLISLIIVIALLAVMFKITGWFLKILGKLLGIIITVFGYLLIGGFAVGVLEMAFFIIPVIIIVGIAAIIKALFSL